MQIANLNDRDGYYFATEGTERIISLAHLYSTSQEECLAVANKPEIEVLRAQGLLLDARRRTLRARLAEEERAMPYGFAFKESRAWNLTVAIVFTIAAYFFSLMTFEPFQLGFKPFFYCGGLALFGLYSVDYFLRQWSNENLLRAVSIILLAVTITTIVLLAVIRGDILAHQLSAAPTVVLDDSVQLTQPTDDFSNQIATLLRLAMVLAALGFEIVAGLAVYNFRISQRVTSADTVQQIRSDLNRTEAALLVLTRRLLDLQTQPALYHATFWRDFYRGLLTAVNRSARVTRLPFIALIAFLGFQHLRGADDLQVVTFDLSKTEHALGYNGRSEFDENVRVVSLMLAQLPAGSELTILGVTDHSFTKPCTLLSAHLSDDPGYFSDRLLAARRIVVKTWNDRARGLAPSYPHTDLLGALVYAGQIFSRSDARRKSLAIVSDMRHEADGFNLEKPRVVDVQESLAYVEKHGLFAQLSGVEVYVTGANAQGKDVTYWRTLREFWTAYFKRCGANVKTFSITREIPNVNKPR